MTDASETHSRPTRLLHWSVALALVGMLMFGYWVAALSSGAEKTAWVQTHKSFGMLAALVIVARVAWRFREGWPMRQGRPATLRQRLAHLSHLLLLGFSLAMPITGILKSVTYARPVAVFGVPVVPQILDAKNETLNELASAAHLVSAVTLALLIALHVAGALYHHIVLRDGTLARMTGAMRRA